MKQFLWQYLPATLIFLILDGLWLGVLMRTFYQHQLKNSARIINGSLQLNLPATLIVYVFLIASLILFALPYAQMGHTFMEQFMRGALFGFVVYGIYEFTNLAILYHWPLPMVIVDTLWGGVLFGLTTAFTLAIYRFGGN